MGDRTGDVIANTLLRYSNQTLELIANILDAIEEVNRVSCEQKIKEIYKNMALNQIPWNEQLVKLQSAILDDPEIPDDVKNAANNVIIQEYEKTMNMGEKVVKLDNNKQFEQLKRIFKKSSLDEIDKKIIIGHINDSMQSGHAPHHINVDRASYRTMVKLLNDQKILNQVTAITTVSGQYLFLYPAAIEPQMKQCAEVAGLYKGILPRPDKEDLEAFAMADKDAPGRLMVFKNLSPELAEKAVMESTKTNTFSFAKKERDDGNFDLFCYAGSEPEEYDRYYKQAVKTIATAAYSLTGPTGDIEAERARYSAKEQKKIDKVIDAIRNDEYDEEDQGYVFSIQHFTDKNNNRFILTDDYIQFGPEEFISYYNGNSDRVSMDTCKDYANTLKLNIQSGPGQKVYISEKEMMQIRQNAAEAQTLIDKSLPPGNRLDQIAYLEQEILKTREKLRTAPSELAQQGFKAELDIQAIALDTLLLHIRDNITIDKTLQRSIGRKLQESEFKKYASPNVTKEMIDNAHACNAAMHDYLTSTDVFDELDTEAHSISDIMYVLDKANFSTYINNLMRQVAPLKPGQSPQPGEMTMDEVKRQTAVLHTEFYERKDAAADLLMDIQLDVIEPKVMGQIQMPNTKNLHTNAWRKEAKLVQRIKQGIEQKRQERSRDLPEPVQNR